VGPKGKRVAKIEVTPMEYADLLLHFSDSSTRGELLRNAQEGVIFHSNLDRPPIKLREADIRMIMRNAPADGVAVADAIQFDINGRLRKRLNPKWTEMFGFSLASGEAIYHPRRRQRSGKEDPDAGASAEEMMGSFINERLEEQNIFKERAGSSAPILIGDALSEYFLYVQKTAAFMGKAGPISNAMKILNYRTPDRTARTFERTVKTRVKNGSIFLKDIYSELRMYGGVDVRDMGVWNKAIQSLIRRAHVAILGVKPQIMLYQTISFNTASNYIEYKYLLDPKNEGRLHLLRIRKEMRENSPMLRDRMDGGGHQIITPAARGSALRQFYGGSEEGWISRSAMKGITEADLATISQIWGAAKLKGKEKGLKGKELMEYVRDTTDEVVNNSQPTWDPLTSSNMINLSRRQPATALIFGMLYASQRSKNFNMMIDAWLEYQESDHSAKAKGMMGRKMMNASLVQSIALVGIESAYFGMLASLAGGDSDEEWADFWWRVGQRFAGNYVAVGDWVGTAGEALRRTLSGESPSQVQRALRPNILASATAATIRGAAGTFQAISEAMTDEENQKKMDEDEWIKTASRAADNLGRGLGVFFRIPVSGVIQAVRPWLPHAQPTRTSAYKKLADSASGKKHDKALRMFEILKEMGASKSHLYSSIKNREKRGDIDSGEADWLKNEVNLYY